MSEPVQRDFESAKKVFFDHDGSRFCMSRDDVEESYAQARVPRQLEAQWLVELKAEKLAALDKPANWKTVYFLKQHGMYDCEKMLLDADPVGDPLERIAYLEELLDYLRRYPPFPSHPLKSISVTARKKVVDGAWSELELAGSATIKERINELLGRAGEDKDRSGR
jgi:hypothetical protein